MIRLVKLTLCVALLAVSTTTLVNAEDAKKADQKKRLRPKRNLLQRNRSIRFTGRR